MQRKKQMEKMKHALTLIEEVKRKDQQKISYGHSLPFASVEAEEISGCRAAEVAVTELSGQICQIYRDELEVTVNGEPFVDCNECAFPVCRPCYEYERREGNQVFPQCKTRYKRIKGSPRVEGDEEEDDTDDLESEFDIGSVFPA
ncbi:hypothetical protein JHK85_045708 [Glycine max]|nr:hypothetical protein JHK85_045708 [Glycine max]